MARVLDPCHALLALIDSEFGRKAGSAVEGRASAVDIGPLMIGQATVLGMFEKFLQLLSFSCRHKHTSQPFAAAASNSAPAGSGEWESVGNGPSHYLVCLDCGKKIPYDWANMRRIG